ncbi:MAG: hypothetical protein ACLFNS_07150 [Desulfobacterales bacterium]
MAAPEYRPRIKKLVNSLEPGEMKVTPKALTLNILGDITIPDPAGSEDAPAPLSPEEMKAFLDIWETWDAFLVNTLLSLSGEPLTPQERQWVPPKKSIGPYFQKVKAILVEANQKNLRKSAIPAKYSNLFQQVVLATAWQETCFRQFIVDDGKLTFIRSYNNTSVGLMQINERVWRGMYNIQHLRWNIHYNAKAGSDILDNYFTKYALPKSQTATSLGKDGLAASIYAMYNGGPSQFSGYLKRR